MKHCAKMIAQWVVKVNALMDAPEVAKVAVPVHAVETVVMVAVAVAMVLLVYFNGIH